MFIKSIVLCSLLCLSSPAVATYGSVVSSIQTLAGIVEEDDQDVNNIESVSGILAAQVELRSFARSCQIETHSILCRKLLMILPILALTSHMSSQAMRALQLVPTKRLRIS